MIFKDGGFLFGKTELLALTNFKDKKKGAAKLGDNWLVSFSRQTILIHGEQTLLRGYCDPVAHYEGAEQAVAIPSVMLEEALPHMGKGKVCWLTPEEVHVVDEETSEKLYTITCTPPDCYEILEKAETLFVPQGSPEATTTCAGVVGVSNKVMELTVKLAKASKVSGMAFTPPGLDTGLYRYDVRSEDPVFRYTVLASAMRML